MSDCARCDQHTQPMMPMVVLDTTLRDMGLKQAVWFCRPCFREWAVAPEARPRTLEQIDGDTSRRLHYRSRLEAFVGAFRAAFFSCAGT